MEATRRFLLSDYTSIVVIALVLVVVAVAVGFNMLNLAKTMPLSTTTQVEGFGGVAVGAGLPDCVRSSSEAAALVGYFLERKNTTEEGEDDLREFTLLLSKLACFKKDLLSLAGVVEATRYQPYSTAHDLEPIAETTARCFAKTIPPRDLDLAFDKWSTRGEKLLDRLCTSYTVADAEHKDLKSKFAFLINDVKDIAKGACLSGKPMIAGQDASAREQGYTKENLEEFGEYKGYY